MSPEILQWQKWRLRGFGGEVCSGWAASRLLHQPRSWTASALFLTLKASDLFQRPSILLQRDGTRNISPKVTMAAILIAAGLVLSEKIEKKRQAHKDLKKAKDDLRYEDLQRDTRRRLARTKSGEVVELSDSEDERTGGGRQSQDASPPRYEDAVGTGKRE